LKECLRVARYVATKWQSGRTLPHAASTDKERTRDGWPWSDSPDSQDAIKFPFAKSTILGVLATGKLDSLLLKFIPKFKDWERHVARGFFWNYPDVALLHALQHKKAPPGWKRFRDETLAQVSEDVAESFDGYMKLALGKIAPKAIAKTMEDLAERFDRRALLGDDDMPDSEGPGLANTLCVDFRVAALARLRLGEKALAGIESIHVRLPT